MQGFPCTEVFGLSLEPLLRLARIILSHEKHHLVRNHRNQFCRLSHLIDSYKLQRCIGKSCFILKSYQSGGEFPVGQLLSNWDFLGNRSNQHQSYSVQKDVDRVNLSPFWWHLFQCQCLQVVRLSMCRRSSKWHSPHSPTTGDHSHPVSVGLCM